MKKILIDIGNTNTAIVAADDARILKKYIISSVRRKNFSKSFRGIFKHNDYGDFEQIIIVSVVPDLLRLIRKELKIVMPGASILVVGEDIKVPIKNKYKNPHEVGQDRLVTSFAACRMYGAPLVVVDFGTAVTFDYVNSKGEYEGGLIFPGLRLALESLVSKTALLPRIKIKPARVFLGKNTRSSMNNGLLFGYAAICDAIFERVKMEYGKEVKIVATGGDAELITKRSRYVKKVYPNLIFTGLGLLSAEMKIQRA